MKGVATGGKHQLQTITLPVPTKCPDEEGRTADQEKGKKIQKVPSES